MPSWSTRARSACVTLVSFAVVSAACSTGSTLHGNASPDPAGSPSVSGVSGSPNAIDTTGATGPAAPTLAAYVEPGFTYSWQRVPLGAGGWVTGVVIQAASGQMYARSDVGGAYRYNATTATWEQMLLASNVPDALGRGKEYAVEAIAVSPADANVVIVSVGGDENPADDKPTPTTGRVLYSADGGHTWKASSTQFFVNGNGEHRWRAERLAIDPAQPQHVLLGTRRQGLWESNDGAATFHQVSLDQIPVGPPNRPGQDHAGVTFATFDPASAGRVYVGVAGTGVFRSDDNGATWRKIIGVAGVGQVPFEGSVTEGHLLVAINTIDGDEPGKLQLYAPDTGVFTDITPARASAWSAAVDPTNPKRMVAADDAVRSEHLWRSSDGGAHWERLDVAIDAAEIPWLGQTDLAGWMSIGRLVFDPKHAGRLWFGEGMGVWMTDDLASASPPAKLTWHLHSRGIEELVVADVATPPGADPIVVAADRQGMRIASMTNYPTRPLVDKRFAGGTDLDFSGKNPSTMVWIGAEYHIYWDDRRVARAAISTDAGATWNELPNLTKKMFGGNVAVSATDPNNIVWLPSYYINPWEHTDQGKGIFVTKNGGKSWQNLTVDGKNNFHRLMWWLNHEGLAADKVDGGVFYLQNDTKEFYVSTDGGTNWKKAANSAPCSEANACLVFGQLVVSPTKAGEVWSSSGEAGLFRTRDRGATPWQQLPGVTEVHAMALGAPLRAGGPNTVFVYGKANNDPKLGIWRSGDDGATWQLIGRVPFDMYADITTISGDPAHPGRVYVGFGGSGVVVGDDPALHG